MTKVKICGITTLEDARVCIEAGVDMLGFNFYAKSKRYIEPQAAVKICQTLRSDYGAALPVLVGLFVNVIGEAMLTIVRQVGLDALQLSGDESPALVEEIRQHMPVFKAIRPSDLTQAGDQIRQYAGLTGERLPALLLDAYHPDLYGGTGLQAADEIALAAKLQVTRLMLAGGLTPENVAARVAAVQPWGVDVASGVENDHPGVKDHGKVRAFIRAAKEASKGGLYA